MIAYSVSCNKKRKKKKKEDFFFFKQKTAYEIKECDWSSDVCSSDLIGPALAGRGFDSRKAGLLMNGLHKAWRALNPLTCQPLILFVKVHNCLS